MIIKEKLTKSKRQNEEGLLRETTFKELDDFDKSPGGKLSQRGVLESYRQGSRRVFSQLGDYNDASVSKPSINEMRLIKD